MSEPTDEPPRNRVKHDELELGRVGVCIYCGSTADLTDEHVIPFGLAGKHVLRDASCRSCATLTSRWERHVLRETLGPFRAAIALPTRKKSSRPTHLTVRVRRGETWTVERVPLEKLAPAAPFPLLPEPGVLAGRPTSETFQTLGFKVLRVVTDGGGETNAARLAGVDAVEMDVPVHPGSFLRLLAKIAWGFTVARFGLGAIEPAVLGVVRGTDDDVARWVGQSADGASLWDAPPDATFRVTVHNDDDGLVVAGVQLFGPQGGPEYLVVVGQLKQDSEGDARQPHAG